VRGCWQRTASRATARPPFTGTRAGWFYALSDDKGEPLWKFQTGGPIHGGPVTFLIDGKQHVAVAAGSGLFVFAL
jgi:outer membrane protein assembly factor BamB